MPFIKSYNEIIVEEDSKKLIPYDTVSCSIILLIFSVIALLGGVIGVLWMIPLRRALIIKTDLPFPEGIAVAAVLTTTVGGEEISDKKSSGGIYLVIGVLVAALLKFGQIGLRAFSGAIHGIIDIGKYNIGGGDRVVKYLKN